MQKKIIPGLAMGMSRRPDKRALAFFPGDPYMGSYERDMFRSKKIERAD